jgi:hypothetical protein
VIDTSADVSSAERGVDDPGKETQIASVDHAETLPAKALPPLKHGSDGPRAITPRGGRPGLHGADALEAAVRSGSAGSTQGGTHMHTGEHPMHPAAARTAFHAQGGR